MQWQQGVGGLKPFCPDAKKDCPATISYTEYGAVLCAENKYPHNRLSFSASIVNLIVKEFMNPSQIV